MIIYNGIKARDHEFDPCELCFFVSLIPLENPNLLLLFFFGFLFLLIYLFRMSMHEQVMASTKNPGEALKIMISGAPASGKGTQCELITQKVSSFFAQLGLFG